LLRGKVRKCVFGVILIGSGGEQILRGHEGQNKSSKTAILISD